MNARARSRAVAAAVLFVVAAGAVTLTFDVQPADAYVGAPWFEPDTVYDDNFPDPSIVVADGRYYAYGGTTGGAYLPVTTSTDLTTWRARPVYDPGPPLDEDPHFNDALPHPAPWGVDLPVEGRLTKQVWAPGAARIGGRYVVYHAVRTTLDRDRFCITVATSDGPLGPFVDETSGPLVCDSDPNGSIDPQPFVDVDGRAHLLWKSEGVPGSTPTRIWSRRLDATGTGFASGSTRHLLLATSQAWEGNVIENPSMVRWGGRLFVFYSANEWRSADYAIGYAECESPAGPCVKAGSNPYLSSTSTRLGPGGPSAFVDLEGRLRLAYHYWNAPHTDYPADPGCDGIDPATGFPHCVSQGQRRMAVTTVALPPARAQALTELEADVLRLYWAFFNRSPDVDGARYWLDQVRAGAALPSIAEWFSQSREFVTRYAGTSDEEYLRRVYGNVLGRQPDAAGFAYWLSLLRGGALTRAGVVLNIAANPEFEQRHPYPRYPLDLLTAVEADVLRLYWAFFNRSPDVDGARYWFDQVRAGAALPSIAEWFSQSREFVTRYAGTSDEEYLRRVYGNVLGRQPDAAGFAYWLSLLRGGALTRAGVVLNIAANPEFEQRHPYPHFP